MKKSIVVLPALFMAATAFAAPGNFSCDAQVMGPNQPVQDCKISVNPNNNSTTSDRPGSIETQIFAGTLTVKCEGYASQFNGSYALWQQGPMSSDDIQGVQSMAKDSYISSHFLPYAFDPSQIASGTNYAGGPDGSVLVFGVYELKNASGNTIGYAINSTLDFMIGCVR